MPAGMRGFISSYMLAYTRLRAKKVLHCREAPLVHLLRIQSGVLPFDQQDAVVFDFLRVKRHRKQVRFIYDVKRRGGEVDSLKAKPL